MQFPKTVVQALTREISNHTPLLLNTGEGALPNNSHMFKFELGWLLRNGFHEMVSEIWSNVNEGHTPLEIWQAKIRRLRQYLRGWAKNVSVQKGEEKFVEQVR